MSTRPPSESSDWEEQDLLTLDEAGQRLHDEVEATTTALDAARQGGDSSAAIPLERRLEALTTALARIRRLSDERA